MGPSPARPPADDLPSSPLPSVAAAGPPPSIGPPLPRAWGAGDATRRHACPRRPTIRPTTAGGVLPGQGREGGGERERKPTATAAYSLGLPARLAPALRGPPAPRLHGREAPAPPPRGPPDVLRRPLRAVGPASPCGPSSTEETGGARRALSAQRRSPGPRATPLA